MTWGDDHHGKTAFGRWENALLDAYQGDEDDEGEDRMSDIVERLRAARNDHDPGAAWSYADEAADEIERLREALRWALDVGAQGYDTGMVDGYGCGCCAERLAVPDNLRDTFNAAFPARPDHIEEFPC